MKNIYEYLTKHGVQAVFTAITGITLASSAAGVVKVAGNINSFKQKVPEIKTVQEALVEDSNLSALSPSPKPSPKLSPKPSPKPTQAASHIAPNAASTATVSAGVGGSIKPSISARGDDDREDREEHKEEDKKDDSEHSKLEIDNDLDISHQEGQLNLNSGTQIQGTEDNANDK